MNAHDIERLLERYYQGSASQEEEQQLKKHFDRDDVPGGLEAEREMFRFFSRQARQDIPLPPGLEERLSKRIDQLEEEEKRQETARPARRLSSPALLRWAGGIAASLVLLLGIGLYRQANDRPRDTFDNPELAYAEARRALNLFGTAFDRGEKQMEKAGNTVQTVQDKLMKCPLFMNP